MKLILFILTFWVLTNAYGQKYSKLETVLAIELPEKSDKDGRWVFYKNKADIEKVNKPLVKAVIPDYDFYKISLTNYLGYHINESFCLILFDSLKSNLILVEPLWYGGINEPLIKLYMKKQFNAKEMLISSLKELKELMEIGSTFKFVNTGVTDSLITYDLVAIKGTSYTTDGTVASSTVKYNEDEVWRQIKIEIKSLKIISYTSINPKVMDVEVIK